MYLCFAGFKTRWGFAAISGLHILPLWIYAMKTSCLDSMFSMPIYMQAAGLALLLAGRIICMFVEVRFHLILNYNFSCELSFFKESFTKRMFIYILCFVLNKEVLFTLFTS